MLHSWYSYLFFSATRAVPFNSHDTLAGNFEMFTVHLNLTFSPTKMYLLLPLIVTWGRPVRADDDCDGNIVPFKHFGVGEAAFRLRRSEDK